MAAIFPAAVATQIQLLTAINNLMCVLDANCTAGDTTITVDDASALPASGYMTFVDTDEVIYYTAKTSNTLTGVTRGADGTSAIAHLAGVDLELRWNADFHNIVTLELKSVEQYLSDRFGITSNIVVPTGKAVTVTDGLGIGAAVDSKAVLSLTSTTKGFLPPRMTTTQRDAISAPTEGLRIYNTTTHAPNVHNGTAWQAMVYSGAIVNADVAAGAAIAYSKLALTGAILNADLAGSIAYSKLTLTGAIVNADLAGSIAYSKLTLTGSVVNADVASAAAIAVNKLAAMTVSKIVVTDASGFLTTSSAATLTELGYLSGVSSGIQAQINALTGGGYLALTGGTMSGAIAMGSHKITGLTDGTAAQDVSSLTQTWLRSINLVDNGGFEIWQKGTSFSAPAATSFPVDRWTVTTNEAAGITLTKETTTIDSIGLASLKLVSASAGASKYWYLAHTIENGADYRGRPISVSVRVKCSVANAIRIRISDDTNVLYSAYHTGGGGWETLTVAPFTPTATETQLFIGLGMIITGEKVNGTFYFDSVMAVLGSECVPFAPTNYQVDLARCQRFFVRICGNNSAVEMVTSFMAISTTVSEGAFRFPVQMRAIPTITITGATNYILRSATGTNLTLTALSCNTISVQSALFQANVASGLVGGNATWLAALSNASYIDASAEV